MIGGAYRSEVIPYATGLYFIDMDRLVEEAVEEALEFKNDGFRAIKMKIGLGDLKLDTKRVAAVREAIGPDIKLAVDANHCFSVPNAIKLGRLLEEHDILCVEEREVRSLQSRSRSAQLTVESSVCSWYVLCR